MHAANRELQATQWGRAPASLGRSPLSRNRLPQASMQRPLHPQALDEQKVRRLAAHVSRQRVSALALLSPHRAVQIRYLGETQARAGPVFRRYGEAEASLASGRGLPG